MVRSDEKFKDKLPQGNNNKKKQTLQNESIATTWGYLGMLEG